MKLSTLSAEIAQNSGIEVGEVPKHASANTY